MNVTAEVVHLSLAEMAPSHEFEEFSEASGAAPPTQVGDSTLPSRAIEQTKAQNEFDGGARVNAARHVGLAHPIEAH